MQKYRLLQFTRYILFVIMLGMFFLALITACGPDLNSSSIPSGIGPSELSTQPQQIPFIYKLPIDYANGAFIAYLILIVLEIVYNKKIGKSWKKTLIVVILLSVVFALLWGFDKVITCLY